MFEKLFLSTRIFLDEDKKTEVGESKAALFFLVMGFKMEGV